MPKITNNPDALEIGLKRLALSKYDPDCLTESEPESLSDKIVRNALNRLPELEGKIVTALCIFNEPVASVADSLLLKPGQVVAKKNSAVNKLKIYIQEERVRFGLLPVYNDCSICRHSQIDKINELIHLWLDAKDWNFRGILNKIKRNYKVPKISLDTVVHHINYHMALTSPVFYDQDKIQDIKGGKKHTSLITISSDMKDQIDRLSKDFGMSNSDIMRMSLSVGLASLGKIFELNGILMTEALKIMKMEKRLK